MLCIKLTVNKQRKKSKKNAKNDCKKKERPRNVDISETETKKVSFMSANERNFAFDN